MCIMHMMPGPSSDGEFIHSFIAGWTGLIPVKAVQESWPYRILSYALL
jgi:hypothetical protein